MASDKKSVPMNLEFEKAAAQIEMELKESPAFFKPTVNEYSYEDEKTVLHRQYLITAKIGMFSLIVGTMHGWTSGVGKDVINGVYGFKMTRYEFICLSALLPFGAIISAFPFVLLAQNIGIKRTLQYLLIPSTISWIFLGAAQNVYMFYIGRFIAGITVGGYKSLITIYLTEFLQTARRGSFSSMGYEFFLVLGILYDQILATLFGARVCTYLCAILPAAAFGVSYFLLETPYYYLQRRDAYGCKMVLIELRGEEYDITSDYVEIFDNYKRYMTVHVPVLETMSKRITKKSLVLAFGLVFFQQMSGINAVLFFIYNLLKIAHVEYNIEYVMIIIYLLQTVGVFIGVISMDIIGRRILLLISEFAVTICTCGIAFYYYMNRHFVDAARVINWVPVFFTGVYIFFFSIGLGAITWLVLTELFPFNVKYHASAIACIFQSFLTFVIVLFFYVFTLNISLCILFSGFSVFSLLGFFFVLLWIPETCNRQFSEIQTALDHKRFS